MANPEKILVILGHPMVDSYCGSLTDEYVKGAEESGAEVRRLNVGDLEFDPILHKAYTAIQQLEDDLLEAQDDLKWADHIVFVFPTWWGTAPTLLRGFIDRVFHPTYAYTYESDTAMLQKKLLTGRSAHLIVTMNAPTWYYRIFYGSAGIKMMKTAVLNFCGISPTKTTLIGNLRFTKEDYRKKWLEKVRKLGLNRK